MSVTSKVKQTEYYNHKITYRKGYAVTVFGGKAWEFESLAQCKKWIQALHN